MAGGNLSGAKIHFFPQVRRLGAELDTSVFSVKSKNKFRARLATLVQKVRSMQKGSWLDQSCAGIRSAVGAWNKLRRTAGQADWPALSVAAPPTSCVAYAVCKRSRQSKTSV